MWFFLLVHVSFVYTYDNVINVLENDEKTEENNKIFTFPMYTKILKQKKETDEFLIFVSVKKMQYYIRNQVYPNDLAS